MADNKLNPTLCLKCRNATGNCSWSAKHKPVSGWNATPTKVRTLGKLGEFTDSFVVHSCPLFVED